jgi:isohexenylglutaconyl-CoA hydratase
MQYTSLIVERDGAVSKITLNRPAAKNALDATMVEELTNAFAAARDEPSVRVVLLRGAGGSFCAGGDLKHMRGRDAVQPQGSGSTVAANRRYGALLELIDALPKAVVALVEGVAMGGGIGLLCVADWTIAEQDTRMAIPEATLGLIPAQIAPFVVVRIGLTQARRLATFGTRFTAAEALKFGFVHELAHGHQELLAKGVAAVNQCLSAAPGAVARTKSLLRRASGEPLAVLLDEAAQDFAAAIGGEAREGIAAFLGKRTPAWVTRLTRI